MMLWDWTRFRRGGDKSHRLDELRLESFLFFFSFVSLQNQSQLLDRLFLAPLLSVCFYMSPVVLRAGATVLMWGPERTEITQRSQLLIVLAPFGAAAAAVVLHSDLDRKLQEECGTQRLCSVICCPANADPWPTRLITTYFLLNDNHSISSLHFSVFCSFRLPSCCFFTSCFVSWGSVSSI